MTDQLRTAAGHDHIWKANTGPPFCAICGEAQARPAVASEGLRAALEPLAAMYHLSMIPFPDDRPVWQYNDAILTAGHIRAARAALAAAPERAALDVERLATALWDASDRIDEYGPWIDQPLDAGKETREYAAAIAAAYAAGEGEQG